MERDLTAEAQAEQEQVQGWVVSAYRTVFHAGLAILRGFGMPADETSRAFVTGAITYAEQICSHAHIPAHVQDRTLDDTEKSLQDGLQAVSILRKQIEDARRDAAEAEAGDLAASEPPPAESPTVIPFDRDRDPSDESNGGGGTPPITH